MVPLLSILGGALFYATVTFSFFAVSKTVQKYFTLSTILFIILSLPRGRGFFNFFHTPQCESPNSIQQNRFRYLQRQISLGELNKRGYEYILYRILLGLSANTLFAAT